MAEVLEKGKVELVFEKVAEASKRGEDFDFEQITNDFLDEILKFKKELKERTGKINDIVQRMEELTWLTVKDDSVLETLQELINIVSKAHYKLIRFYTSFNVVRKEGIAKEELLDFKHSLDNLKEIKNDLYSVFFVFPKDKEFQSITKKLSNI